MGLIVSCVGEEKEQASPTIEEEEEEEEEDAGGDVFDSNETCEQIVRAKFQFAHCVCLALFTHKTTTSVRSANLNIYERKDRADIIPSCILTFSTPSALHA